MTFFKSVFIVLFLLSSFSLAQEAPLKKIKKAAPKTSKWGSSELPVVKPTAPSLTDNASDLVDTLLEKTPDLLLSTQEKIAAKGYLYKIGLKSYGSERAVGGSNVGINHYFTKMWGGAPAGQDTVSAPSQCFRDKVIAFYAEIKNKIKDKKTSRANIYTKLGSEGSEGLKPGWLWEMAMKYSNGDSYAAMTLIGMCGHDDVQMADFEYLDKSPAAKNAVAQEIELLKVKKKELTQKLAIMSKDDKVTTKEFSKVSGELSDVTWTIESYEKRPYLKKALECPPAGTAFFYPESLGAGVDIPTELKDKIANVQYKAAPSKHYHVYGAAFMACGLISNGMGPVKAVTLQRESAKFYRGLRLCSDINNQSLDENDPNVLKKNFSQTDLDKFELYKRWYLGQKVFGKNIPCTDVKLKGPRDLTKLTDAESLAFKPTDWTDERYQQAGKSLASAMLDFEWTSKQHEVGAKFAAAHCKEGSNTKLNPFESMCKGSSTSPTSPITTSPSGTPSGSIEAHSSTGQ